MKRSLSWIAQAIDASFTGVDDDVDLALATTDSRECVPGSLYFARVGENADGHDFLTQARQNGAAAAIVEREVPDLEIPQLRVADATIALGDLAKAHLAELRADGATTRDSIQVLGVTGSAGKTTTKDLLANILARSGPTVAPKLSFNNEVGCPLTILKADRDTRYLVLEMGASGSGHIRYLTEIAPLDVAIELMVGRAHLGGYEDGQTVADAKRELVEGLLPNGVAVLNKDDAQVAAMAEAAPDSVLFFSAAGAEDAVVRATFVKVEADGCPSFVLETPDFRGRVQLGLVGEHQVSNALAAVAGNLAVERSTIEAVRALENATAASPHRMDVTEDVLVQNEVGGVTPVTLIDDSYNANPDSMAASFQLAQALRGSARLVMVLGEMLELGDDSVRIHQEVGRNAGEISPEVVIGVGDGTRALLEALPEDTQARWFPNETEALQALEETVQPGDFVLLKGSYGSGVWKIAESLNGKA